MLWFPMSRLEFCFVQMGQYLRVEQGKPLYLCIHLFEVGTKHVSFGVAKFNCSLNWFQRNLSISIAELYILQRWDREEPIGESYVSGLKTCSCSNQVGTWCIPFYWFLFSFLSQIIRLISQFKVIWLYVNGYYDLSLFLYSIIKHANIKKKYSKGPFG